MQIPKYNEYIDLLENYIKNETNLDDFNFDWDIKMIGLIKKNMDIKKIMDDIEITQLFNGYPKFFIQNYIEKYLNNT